MAGTEEHSVRVRFAPSPTGPFHVGSARTALFNWLFARNQGGCFILRIEDTDLERSKKAFEAEIASALSWLGLEWDEGPELRDAEGKVYPAKGTYGPYRQSERRKIYRTYLKKLLDEKKAYYCYCTKEELELERQAFAGQGLPPKYSGHCRELTEPPKKRKPQVIRFKTPEIMVEVKDVIRGKVTFDGNLLGDIVIAKDLDTPLYNFAVVVDDETMNITHVVRGEDHLSNTPKQILFQHALGFREVTYAHLPLILNPDRSKLSKRYAEVSLLEYRNRGFLPEALVNFLAFLGWHPSGDEEVLNIQDITSRFSLKRVQKAGAVFNEEKLEWLNGEHLRRLNEEEIAHRLESFAELKDIGNLSAASKDMFRNREFLLEVIRLERERLATLEDFFEVAGFFFSLPEYDPSLLIWQRTAPEKIREILEKLRSILESQKVGTPSRMALEKLLAPVVEEEGRGPVLWPLRVALSGKSASPDPIDIMEVLGPKESMRRIESAIQKLRS